MSTENVTDRVVKAIGDVEPAEATAVRNKVLTTLEADCEQASKQAGTPLACESVTLYQGGQYWLYKYKRYEDVRLTFAPEQAIGAFGGDPDNFQFPRWCLDMSLLRVYENGKPASTPDHLSFEWGGAKDGEPVFVAGHPGTTQRLLTVAQLKTQRDVFLPFWLLRFSELRGRMIQSSKTSAEAERTAQDYLGSVENAIKVRRMQLASLLDDRMMEQHAAAERKLRDAVNADATVRTAAGSAWDDIARAEQRYREILIPYTWLEGGAAFNSELFGYARQLVRAADERAKPNAERLREYTDAGLARLKPAVEAATPVYPAFEEVRLSFSLERMREYLGPDHPIVKAVLGAKSPDERARELVTGSSLADPKERLKLFEGGAAAVRASTDTMIVLAREVDAESRRLRKIYEEVQGIEAVAQQKIAEARFKIYGTQVYPDATFTLRLSYGGGRRMDRGRHDGRPLHAARSPLRASNRCAAIRAAEIVARRETTAGDEHARQFHHHQRHRWRQLRQPHGQRCGPHRRPGVRRQYPFDCWKLLVRSANEPDGWCAPRVHADGAGAGVSRDPAHEGARDPVGVTYAAVAVRTIGAPREMTSVCSW